MSERNQNPNNIFFTKPPPLLPTIHTPMSMQNQQQPHRFGQPPPRPQLNHQVKIIDNKTKDDDAVIPLPLPLPVPFQNQSQVPPRLPPRNRPVVVLPTELIKLPIIPLQIDLSDSSDSDTICISSDEEGEIVSESEADTSSANLQGNDEDEIKIIGVHINKDSPTYLKNKKKRNRKRKKLQEIEKMKAKNGQFQHQPRRHGGETPTMQIARRKSLKRIGQGGTGTGNKFISMNRKKYNPTTPKSLLKKMISRNSNRRQNYVQPRRIKEKYSKLHDISFTPQAYPKPRIISWTTNGIQQDNKNQNNPLNLIPRTRITIANNNENFDSLSRGFNRLNFRQNNSPPKATTSTSKNMNMNQQQQQHQKNVNAHMNRKRSSRSPTRFQNKWPTSYVPPGTTSGDKKKGDLRPIIIDGSNIAMQHGRRYMIPGSCGKPPFSCKGIEYCVNYFKQRGHPKVMAFVPAFRKEVKSSKDTHILFKLERDGNLFCTPSRKVNDRQICSYDDRFILQIATQLDGIVVSCDNYKDLFEESPELRPVIEKRLLPFVWVEDILMFPPDPLGPKGPNLDDFLRF